jgi:hypothetical protein
MKSLLITVLCIPLSISAMKIEESKKYTVGMKIPTQTFAGQPINPVHMTITYLGSGDKHKLERAKKYLAEINGMRPLKVVIESLAMFGTSERPIPVRRLRIEDPVLEQKLIDIHKELGECEPGQPKKLDTPNWHVSIKDPKLAAEFEARSASKDHAMLNGGKLFIKPLGNFDPIAEFE